MGTSAARALRCRALWARQNGAYPLYVFFLTPAELLAVADMSRISRDDAGKLIGYQRPEVKRHVREITEYLDGICAVLVAYWKAVRDLFPDAWGKPPATSRLMHGAGIRAVGRLMDRVMAGINPRAPRAAEQIERELRRVAPVCRWTGGVWEGLNDLPWDAVESAAPSNRDPLNRMASSRPRY